MSSPTVAVVRAASVVAAAWDGEVDPAAVMPARSGGTRVEVDTFGVMAVLLWFDRFRSDRRPILEGLL